MTLNNSEREKESGQVSSCNNRRLYFGFRGIQTFVALVNKLTSHTIADLLISICNTVGTIFPLETLTTSKTTSSAHAIKFIAFHALLELLHGIFTFTTG